jgi:hypothetical protein
LTPEEVRVAFEHYYRLLRAAEDDYTVAAARTAQYVYLWGTLLGVILLALFTGFIAIAAREFSVDMDDERIATAFACAIAGGLGAAASVSWRVTVGDFSVDPGAGILTLRRLGSVRPFIGAIFGIALYFALKSGFINIGESNRNFYFFAFLAFVAGFSERVIPELLRTAEQRLGGREESPRRRSSGRL